MILLPSLQVLLFGFLACSLFSVVGLNVVAEHTPNMEGNHIHNVYKSWSLSLSLPVIKIIITNSACIKILHWFFSATYQAYMDYQCFFKQDQKNYLELWRGIGENSFGSLVPLFYLSTPKQKLAFHLYSPSTVHELPE